MSSRKNKNIQYFLYVNNNGREIKLDYTFNSLLDVDLTTAQIDNPDSLFENAPQFKSGSSLFIKDSKGKNYSVIYNNPFLVKYIKEKKINFFERETLGELHKFLNKIKRYITSDKKGYLTDVKNQEDIKKYLEESKLVVDDIRPLILPKKIIDEIDLYAYRKDLVDRNTREFDGNELKREFYEIDEKRFLETFVANYDNLHILIAWDQNYDRLRQKIDAIKNIEDLEKRTLNNGQIVFPGFETLKGVKR